MRRPDPEPGPPEPSPAEVEFLQAWLESRSAPPAPAAGEPGYPAAAPAGAGRLVAYLGGMLPAAEARALERELVTDAAARARLREAGRELRRLQAGSPAALAGAAAGEGFAAEVARAWQEAMAGAAGDAAGARQQWSDLGWEEVRRRAAEGIAGARAAWAAFTGLGEVIQAALRLPRLATARGEADEILPVEGLPAGVRAVVGPAEVEPDGRLRVELELAGASAELEGREAWLAVTAAGEEWPVARARVQAAAIRWEVAGLGAALDLPAGPVPVGCLRVRFEGTPERTLEGAPRLLATALDAGGRPAGAAELLLTRGPRCESGELRIGIGVPGLTRALYPDHRLVLRLRITPGGSQYLGAWSLSEWADTPRELAVPCPGLPEATLSPLLLQICLAPDEAVRSGEGNGSREGEQ